MNKALKTAWVLVIAQAVLLLTVIIYINKPVSNTSDINGDGVVDALDLSQLLDNWTDKGQTPNPKWEDV